MVACAIAQLLLKHKGGVEHLIETHSNPNRYEKSNRQVLKENPSC